MDNVPEEQENIYLKITRDHLNLPEVQKLLGYSTGPENKTDKEVDITNVIQVPDQPQPQQHNSRVFSRLSDGSTRPISTSDGEPSGPAPSGVSANDGDPSGTAPSGLLNGAITTTGNSWPCSSTTGTSASSSSSATAASSTEPEFYGQCSAVLLPGGGSGHQAPKIWKYHISYLIHIVTNLYLLLKVMHYESNAT